MNSYQYFTLMIITILVTIGLAAAVQASRDKQVILRSMIGIIVINILFLIACIRYEQVKLIHERYGRGIIVRGMNPYKVHIGTETVKVEVVRRIHEM